MAEPSDDSPLAGRKLQGLKYLDRLLPLFGRLHDVGCQRDRAGNRQLQFDQNVAALQDRGHVLLFEPGAAEVHRKAGTWFDDAEIYEWFAANLHRVREPSLRHYVRAKELKAARMDWTEVLATEAENRRARLAAEILASVAYGSMAERVQAFVEQGGGCRATFFNHRRKLGSRDERGRLRGGQPDGVHSTEGA